MSDSKQQTQGGFLVVDSTDTTQTQNNTTQQPLQNDSFVIADLADKTQEQATYPPVDQQGVYNQELSQDKSFQSASSVGQSPYQETVVIDPNQQVQYQSPVDMPLPPEPVPTVDTVVIPPVGSQNQFIPQGLAPAEVAASNNSNYSQNFTPPPVPKASGGGFPKVLLFIVLGLLILLGIGAAVFGGMKFVETNKEVTITYWGLWEDSSIIEPIIEEFQAQNPKIKVIYQKQNHREYRERVQNAILRGEGPDVFRYHSTWIPMLKNEIQPLPPDLMTPAEFTSSFYKVAAQDLVAGSTIWGIPLMIDGLGLYINDDLLQSAGVSAPSTYEELLEIVPKLTVKNGNDIVTSAIALGTANNVAHFSDILALMIMQNGGKLTDPTGSEAEEALAFYRKFSTPSDLLYTWNELLDNSISAFANGRVAMIFAPSWRVFDIKTLSPNLRFHIAPVPQLPGSDVAWASYWVEGVSAKSQNQKQAFLFLKYLTSKEAATKLYTEASKTRLFGEPYALTSLGSNLQTDPYVYPYVSQANFARSFPLASYTHDGGLNDRMIKYMEDAINSAASGTSPSQALDTMAKGFRQVLTSYGLTSSSAP